MGAATALVVTRRGVYLSPDGLAYVGAARNLVDGHGLTAPPGAPPLGNFPPLYPLLLAVAGFGAADPLTVARFVNPLLFGATIVVVGMMARRLTGSLPLALAAQLLVLSGEDFLAYHSSALSEPLFLLLALLAVAALAGRGHGSRPLLLVTAALLVAAACLTRYIGLALVAAGAVGLVLLDRRRRRWRAVVTFTGVALFPLTVWLLWVGDEGQGANRTPVFHAPGLSYVGRGVETASRWLLPDTAPQWARVTVLAATMAALVVGLLVDHRRRQRGEAVGGPTRMAVVLALFSLAYLAALVGDRLLFEVTGRLDTRFLLPLHATAVLLAVWALATGTLVRSRLALAGMGALVGVQLVSGGMWVGEAATSADVRPGGFGAPRWVHSRVIDDVRTLAPHVPVYTNDVGALHFHTRRVARPLPQEVGLLTGRRNPDYEAELEEVARGLRGGGLLVYFTAVPARREALAPPDELAGRLGLEELGRDEVGRLYRLRGPDRSGAP